MMTAEERLAPRVSGGDMRQDADKSKPLLSLENPLLDAADGTLLSALLQHALDSLSASASTTTAKDKTEVANPEAQATTAPPPRATSSAPRCDMRYLGRVSETVSTSLRATTDTSSTLLLARSREDARQRQGRRTVAEGAAKCNHGGEGARDLVTGGVLALGADEEEVRLPRELSSGPEAAVTLAEGTGCGKSFSTPAARRKSSVAVSVPLEETVPSALGVDNVCSKAAAMKSARVVEAEENTAAEKYEKDVVTLMACQQFPPSKVADATRPASLSAASAAFAADLPRRDSVLSQKPAAATFTSALLESVSARSTAETSTRHTPFHVLLTRLCGHTEIPSPSCVPGSLHQRHEDDTRQKASHTHQQDVETLSDRKAYDGPAVRSHTFLSNVSPALHESSESPSFDNGAAAAFEELIARRPPCVGGGDVFDVSGALLQQQSIGRALLTRLASLQVQQRLLRYAGSLPRPPRQAAVAFKKRPLEHPSQPPHEARTRACERREESLVPPLGEWPVLGCGKERLAVTPTLLQQSELLTLTQNHSTCVFHFVIRALCLLANCCPVWASQRSGAANVIHNHTAAPPFGNSGKIPRTAMLVRYASQEIRAPAPLPLQDVDKAYVYWDATRNSAASESTRPGTPTTSHCRRVLPPHDDRGLPTAACEDTCKKVSPGELSAAGHGGCIGISSYRWHWMHVVSFLTHPELLSVYHSTLAPLVSLFVQNAQCGSAKHCARIESLDTSSSHDDEAATTGENVSEKPTRPASQGQHASNINSSSCGAASWLVVRQVLGDLDDLRSLHDPYFLSSPQQQDPSVPTHLHQHQMKLSPHSHHECCAALPQGAPVLCCGALQCSDRCPGAFYCGTALLRSSILFESFLEACRALAMWPQHLAAAAAAALPSSSELKAASRSAFLTTDKEGGASIFSSLARPTHAGVSIVQIPDVFTASAPKSEQLPEGNFSVNEESTTDLKKELAEAARGVAACILKHVDLNKLDSAELLALSKLTEKAGSPSTLSPSGEQRKAGGETSAAHSPATLARPPSPVFLCDLTNTLVPPSDSSDVRDGPEHAAASKRPETEVDTSVQPRHAEQPQRSACQESSAPCPHEGDGTEERQVITPGECTRFIHLKSARVLSAAGSTAEDLPASARRGTRCSGEAPSLSLAADGKSALPGRACESLLHFFPLFGPRRQQRKAVPVSAAEQDDTASNTATSPNLAELKSAGEGDIVATSDAVSPAAFPDKEGGGDYENAAVHTAFPPCNVNGMKLQDNLRDPDTSMRRTSLTEPAAVCGAELQRLPDSTQRYAQSTSLLRASCTSLFSTAEAPDAALYKNTHLSGCKRPEIRKKATSAPQKLAAELCPAQHGCASSAADTVPNGGETQFFSVTLGVGCPLHTVSEADTCLDTSLLPANEGRDPDRKAQSTSSVSALDIVEHERALSLVAAGVRNTRKRFRLPSVKRKGEARIHYGVNCLTIQTEPSSWDTKMEQISLQSMSSKEHLPLASPPSTHASTPSATESTQNKALCKLVTARVVGSVSGARRRHAESATSAANGTNSSFNTACHVRSPVKGIYYDSYKKLWRVQWNSGSSAPQQTAANVSVNGAGHGGSGRRVSRSFSCARLGFEAAKARAVAWMLSGGHVGDGGLADVIHREPEDQANPTTERTVPRASTGENGSVVTREPDKDTSSPPSQVQSAAERQRLTREQKEKLLFANPKLFLEKVEAFYVRNGLYGLQCGSGPAGGPADRQGVETKSYEEQQQGEGGWPCGLAQAANSRKGNGGTGGLRIVSVLSLEDMLDIVQGRKTTMSFPYAALKHASREGHEWSGRSEITFAADTARARYGGQHQTLHRGPPREETASHCSELCLAGTESSAEFPRKKPRTREAVAPLEQEDAGQRRLSKSFEGQLEEKVSA